MTTARHIVTLLKSYIAGDEDRFLATAMQLAAHEARQGHGKLAQEVKELVDAAKAKEIGNATPEAGQSRWCSRKVSSQAYSMPAIPMSGCAEMILPDAIRARLERVLERTEATAEPARSRASTRAENCCSSAHPVQARL